MKRSAWICGAMFAAVMALPALSFAGATTPPLTLVKTVGIDPTSCAPTKNIVVAKGTTVIYCYTVTNNEPFTLTTHSLDDSVLGPILTNDSFDLPPNGTHSVKVAHQIDATTINVATWTAVGTDETMTMTDSAPISEPDVVKVSAESSAEVSIAATAAPAGLRCDPSEPQAARPSVDRLLQRVEHRPRLRGGRIRSRATLPSRPRLPLSLGARNRL
jgi:hypothetical protein